MRQSKNYKWNLPEDDDVIDVEDLNAVFTSIDEQLHQINRFVSSIVEGNDIVWLKYAVTANSTGLKVAVVVEFNGEERYSGTIQGTYPVQNIDSTYLRIWYNYDDDALTVRLENSTSGRLPTTIASLFSKAIGTGEFSEIIYCANNGDGYAVSQGGLNNG